jgi:hypothetical protein
MLSMRTRTIALLTFALALAGCQTTAQRPEPLLPASHHPSAGRDMAPGSVWRSAAAGTAQGRWIVGSQPGLVVYESRLPAAGLREVRPQELAGLTASVSPPAGEGCRIELTDGAQLSGGAVQRQECDGTALAGVVSWRRDASGYVFLRRDGRSVRVRIID